MKAQSFAHQTWAMVASAMLAVTLLAGCGGQAAEPVVDDEVEEEVVEVESLTSPESDEEADQEDTTDVIPPTGPTQVQVGGYSFALPSYWEGSVEVDVDGQSAVVHLPGNPEATLARLELVDGDEAEIGGDIGNHLVGSVSSGNGTHVEVWSTNWPWIAVNARESVGVSDDELASLVDLSTGGLLAFDDLASTDEETLTGAEYGYMSAELVPTVAFG